ncbi:MAG: ABC transporter substrate-binding protein [Oscillibacter sp.]|nr:ABC transporter substrate-binding protein [Oscillibacter sp.]
MKLWKNVLALLLILSLAACGQAGADAESPSGEPETPPAEEPAPAPVTVRIGALKGPTAMGMANLAGMESYELTLAGSADELTPAFVKGDLDILCVPANLASVLYNQTDGEVLCLAVNTLGVLYIVENGDTIHSMADLAGKTIAAAGKGSTPEFGLRYLLAQNGLDPDADVTIDWKSEHAECVAALAAGTASAALLPQPFVTVAQTKQDTLRVALDLTEEWEALDNGSAMITGVAAIRRSFAEEHPEAVELLRDDYAASVAWVNANPADAAARIGELGILEAAVAEKALPYCNIVCIQGAEMESSLSGYLQTLFDALPQSVGGALPGHDFYYGA